MSGLSTLRGAIERGAMQRRQSYTRRPTARFGGGGSRWTPERLSSLVSWWDFSADKTTLNGSDVASCVSRAHNGSGPFTLVQGTAGKQPLWNSANSNLNNQPSATYTPANVDQLTCDAIATGGYLDQGNAHTVFVAGYRASAGATHHIFGCGDSASASLRYEFRLDASDDVSMYHSTASGSETAAKAGTYGIGRHVVGISKDNANVRIYADRDSVATSAYTVAKSPSGLDYFAVGTYRFFSATAGGQVFDGSIGDIVVCSSALSGSDLTNLQSFLWSKHGV